MKIINFIGKKLKKYSIAQQIKQGTPSPALWNLQSNEKGELVVGNTSCVKLAKEYGTPLLVVHKKALQEHVRNVQEILNDLFEKSMITYSYKTNCIPGILKILHDMGVGAEVISGYEYWVAQSLGVSPEKVVFNGVDKSHKGIAHAVSVGAQINIDNIEEVYVALKECKEQNKKARIGIRLGMSLDTQLGVFINSDDMDKVLKLLFDNAEHFDVCAIHFNTMSNAKDSNYHVHCTEKALEFIKMLKDVYNANIQILDIGGGMGVSTSKNMTSKEYALYRLFGLLPKSAYLEPYQELREYFKAIAVKLHSFCKEHQLSVPMLVIEPGRMLTSQWEFMLTRVNSIKNPPQKPPYAITDGGRLSHAFPCDFELHEALLANDLNRPLHQEYVVTGRVCTRSDWLYRGKVFPKLEEGDVLAIMDAGAYFSSYAMNFAFPRAEIIAVEDDKVEVLRKRESYKHLVGMDNVDFINIEE